MEQNQSLKKNAQTLRKNMTKEEAKLWYQCLCRGKYRFRRQYIIGNYIVDFYCAQAQLVIELDGGGHYYPDQMKADAERAAALESMKLRILRICNTDIDRNFRGVCEFIDIEVRNSLPQSPSVTAPSSEGASVQSKNQI